MSNIKAQESVAIGVLSIQERIKAMNETLDTVEQRHTHQKSSNTNAVSPSTSELKSVNGDSSLSLPPFIKRSSVVDIWRSRESQTASGGIAVPAQPSAGVAKVKKSTLFGQNEIKNDAKTDNCSIDDTSQTTCDANDAWYSHTFTKQHEEKKEVMDFDDDHDSRKSNTGPIRTVASASPSPPLIPGSKHKNSIMPSPLKSLGANAISDRINSIDLTIVHASSTISTSSGMQTEKPPSKVALIREKLMGNTAETSKSSLKSSSSTISSTMDVRQKSSNEENLKLTDTTKHEQKSPKRQSVVDIWKEANTDVKVEPKPPSLSKPPSSIVEAANTYCDPFSVSDHATPGKPMVDLDNKSYSGMLSDELLRKHDKDHFSPVHQRKVNGSQSEILLSSNWNTTANVTNRWARRVAERKTEAATPSVVESSPKTSTLAPDTVHHAEGDNEMTMLLTNTFSKDRKLHNSANKLESDSQDCTSPLQRQGKVSDRYKFLDTTSSQSSIKPTLNSTISSLVKEYASSTPIVTYKKKSSNRNDDEPSTEQDITNKTHSEKVQSVTQLSDDVNVGSSVTYAAISNSVTTSVDKQDEKRESRVTDRWIKNFSGKDDGNDTVYNLPRSHRKVTDRWKPNGVSASEPGSKFDSATVAELLKLHAGKTPAGKVRGMKPNQVSKAKDPLINVQDGENTGSNATNTNESLSPPRPHTSDRSTVRESPCTKGAVSEMIASKILALNIKEQFKTNVESQTIEEADDGESDSGKSQNRLNVAILNVIGSEAKSSERTNDEVKITNRWKNRLLKAKENDLTERLKEEHRSSALVENASQRKNATSIAEVLGDESNSPLQLSPFLKSDYCLPPTDKVSGLVPAASFEPEDEVKHDTLGPPTHIIEAWSSKGVSNGANGVSLKNEESRVTEVINSSSFSQGINVVSKEGVFEGISSNVGNIVNSNLVIAPTDDNSKGKLPHASAFNPWPVDGDALSQVRRHQVEGHLLHPTNALSNQEQKLEETRCSSISPPVVQSDSAVVVHLDNNEPSQSVKHENASDRPYFIGPVAPNDQIQLLNSNGISAFDKHKISIAKEIVEDNLERQPVKPKASSVNDTLLSSTSTISLSTKKLASDRASNKKRLQQYRGKAKGVSSKTEPSNASLALKGGPTRAISNDSAPSDSNSEYHNSVSNVPITKEKNKNRRSSGTAKGQPTQPANSGIDQDVLDGLCNSVSTSSSSPLASKAEKILQDRRQRTSDRKQQGHTIDALPRSALPHDEQLYSFDVEEPVIDEHRGVTDCDRRRLSTIYNKSSRFIDKDVSGSTPGILMYDSESVESSCDESGTTSGSNSRYYHIDRPRVSEKALSSKRRHGNVKDPPGQISQDRSLNLSSHSNWDSDWGGNVSMMSMDFDKLVSAVDEQVSAFRDFVGIGAKKPVPHVKPKSKHRTPSKSELPMEVEDVAIEVEYVEDSFHEDDFNPNLGFCTAPVDDIVRQSLEFSSGAKANLCRGFHEPYSEMSPTGEPSCERIAATRKQSNRNGYV